MKAATYEQVYYRVYEIVLRQYREQWLRWLFSKTWREMAHYDAEHTAAMQARNHHRIDARAL